VTLQLVQVRLPPGYAANASPQRPQQVHSALYSHGTTFLATTTASDNDVVWTLSNSLFPAAQQLSETQNTLGLDGKTWALAEVTPAPKRAIEASAFAPPAPEPPLIVTQHSLGPRKFIFLTTQCCHVVTQLRPVDILRQLLFDASGPDSTAVRAFFQVLREDQACATALILACSTSIQDSQLADWAARAFFLLGGDVKISSHSVHPISSPASPFIVNSPGHLNTTPSHFQHQQSYSTFTSPDGGGMGGFNPNAISTPQLAPYSPQSNTMLAGGGGEATDYQFSGRHNGLYLYFGRILRPVWLMPLARDVGKPQQPLLDSVVTSEELLTVLGQLNALKGFVHANIHQNGPSSYKSSEKGRIQV
jgi:nuclear pore complex protein Nup155